MPKYTDKINSTNNINFSNGSNFCFKLDKNPYKKWMLWKTIALFTEQKYVTCIVRISQIFQLFIYFYRGLMYVAICAKTVYYYQEFYSR